MALDGCSHNSPIAGLGVAVLIFSLDGDSSLSSAPRVPTTMKPDEQTEEEIILAFAVSDDALEFAASPSFSLGNCTDARICPVDG